MLPLLKSLGLVAHWVGKEWSRRAACLVQQGSLDVSWDGGGRQTLSYLIFYFSECNKLVQILILQPPHS